MVDGRNDSWGSEPEGHRSHPEQDGAAHARPWYRSPALLTVLVILVLVGALALFGGQDDAEVSDVPQPDANPLPVEDAGTDAGTD